MRKSLRVASLVTLLALSVPAFIGFSHVNQADAYSTSSLPTTIDLNDCSSSTIRNYYSALNNKSASERQGTNLLKHLKDILKNGQKYYSYDSGNAIWQIYEIADRDWDKSPASSTTYGTYNANTNKITNYSYGTSASSSKNNPYIHALYINRNVTNQTTAWDDHQQTQWGINREHVWPKAEGFETESGGGARGDPMHLMAGNGYSNNIHSNYYYGYVNTSQSYVDCGSTYSNQKGNLRGKNKTTANTSGTATVFEPQDCDKGDIARAIFYMAARYNYYANDGDTIDSDNPNLILTQSVADWAKSGYVSSTSNPGKMGILTDLLNWHHTDPVDEYEIHRNNLLYKNYTNNRNPFIDFPEWVDFIWGKAVYNGKTYSSYSSTPTGSANPNSDTINGYNSSSAIAVTGVSVSPTSTEVEEGKTVELTETITPSNATDKTVTWTSSNTSVASVSGGVVTGVSQGNATITVTTNDGNFSATCNVTVTESSDPSAGTVDAPQTLDTAVTTIASGNSYSNYSEESSGFNWTITCGSKQTNSPAGLWFGSNSGNKAKMILNNGSYSEASAIASAIGVSSSSTYYAALFQKAGGTKINNVKSVTLTYATPGGTAPSEAWIVYSTNNATSWNVFKKVTSLSPSGTTFEADSTIASALYGFVIHCSNYCQFKVPVLTFNAPPKTLESIELNTDDVQRTFELNEEFNHDALSVTANYSDLTSALVVPTSVSTPSTASVGEKTVTVTYTEGDVSLDGTYTITVVAPAKTLSSISVSNPKTSFETGDTFEIGGTVTAHYSDSTSDDVTNSCLSSGYDMSTAGNYTVTISYTEGEVTRTAQYQITVTQAVITTKEYTLYSGTITEGDYVIYYGGKALKNTVSTKGRFDYLDATPSNDKIVDPASSIVWHIAQSGSYWTIYNSVIDGYAASTGVANKAQLLEDDSEDMSLWTVSGSSNYEFVNKYNAAQSISANLRNNGTYGFACYSTSTGGALSLYKYTSSAPLTSITATPNKTFHVGETITSSDITVTGDNGQNITGFSFANNNYRFTYADSNSGGTSKSKTFSNSITFETFSCDLTVNVSRTNYATPEAEKTYSLTTSDFSKCSGTGSGSATTNKITKNNVDFYATETYVYSNNYLSFKTTKVDGKSVYTSNSILSNDQAFSSPIKSVGYELYGNNKPAIDPTIEFSLDKSSWSTTNNGYATYFRFRYEGEFTGFVNLQSFTVVTEGIETATNVANYIMYEDTPGQCETKFNTASGYFNSMSKAERNSFMTSTDYVISTARSRFNDWAKHLGKQIISQNDDYVIQGVKPISILPNKMNSDTTWIVVIVSILGAGVIAGYFYVKRKKNKEQEID